MSSLVKKAVNRIIKLEKEKQNLKQGKIDMDAREKERVIDMDAREKERVQSMEHVQRGLVKDRRQLQVEQDELVKQKGIQECHSESLTYHRDLNRTERHKIKRSHTKALEHITYKSAIDREVCNVAVLCQLFVSMLCIVSLFFNSLIALSS